jgi:type I restriction enzyme M protein
MPTPQSSPIVLRDDGLSYGDYLEQLTYLLFLKMDDENVQVLNRP